GLCASAVALEFFPMPDLGLVSGLRPTACGLPLALSMLGFVGKLQNRGGIGCADYVPPPHLGASLLQGLLPCHPLALSMLSFVGKLQNRGGIGCADYMPPPHLGTSSVASDGTHPLARRMTRTRCAAHDCTESRCRRVPSQRRPH
ncbi:MAG: hypothetical protein AAB263_22330, partial [Planctomycetota bacterium]